MGITSYIKKVKNDEERKSLLKILKEAMHCALIEKEIPNYYFTSLLYKKGADDYRNYVGHKKIFNITDNFFYPNGRNANLEDKIIFNQHLLSNDINTPIVFANNDRYHVQVQNDGIVVNSKKDLSDLIIRLLNEARSESIFIKPVEGEGGKHSFKFNKSNLSNDAQIIELYDLMNGENFIFQEAIIQHESINQIYPESVNTLRVHTFFDRKTGEVDIASALMRFGYGGHVIDNGSSGGMFIPINIETWSLSKNARSYLKSGGNTFSKHPDTNYKFNDTILPYREETYEIVKEASHLFSNDFIGWDIAITDKGPMIIEGNDGPHMIMAQMACGGLKAHPKYKDIFSEYL